jgi:hypothetical protein
MCRKHLIGVLCRVNTLTSRSFQCVSWYIEWIHECWGKLILCKAHPLVLFANSPTCFYLLLHYFPVFFIAQVTYSRIFSVPATKDTDINHTQLSSTSLREKCVMHTLWCSVICYMWFFLFILEQTHGHKMQQEWQEVINSVWRGASPNRQMLFCTLHQGGVLLWERAYWGGIVSLSGLASRPIVPGQGLWTGQADNVGTWQVASSEGL